ncbi:MAG: vWA domain-containing protein, partial [Planctomycetota bacterium]
MRDALDELCERVFEQGGIDSKDDRGEVDVASIAMVDWDSHPLDLLLPRDGSHSWNARNGEFSARIGSQTEAVQTESSLDHRRRTQLAAANRLRSAAPFWFPSPAQDPITQLRTTNLQVLLVWHANRSITDFWGPAGRKRSYYDVAASDYCVAASKLGPRIRSASSSDEVAAVTVLLQSTRRFLPNWLATSAAPGIRIDSNGQIRSELTVLSNQPADFAAPSGTASVTVRGERNSIELAQVMPSDAVVLPTIGGHYTMTLPNSIADDEDQLVAQAMFRGHEYGRPLKLAKIGGYKVRVTPNHKSNSTVTVSDGSNGASIAIILDGSASMGDALESKTKLAVAKSGLNQLLSQIAARGDTQVSLRVFGHRVGWSTTTPVQRMERPGIGALAEGVLPSRDVEALFRLNSFGPQEMRQLQSRVAVVQPWGQSPLYLAVKQSLEEFDSQDNSKRHLIVITDGENYQFAPPSDTDFEPTTARDVLELSRLSDVPIHILGLGVDEAKEPAVVAEFEQLGKESGGGFQALTSATDLTSTLEQLLLRPNYELRSIDRS